MSGRDGFLGPARRWASVSVSVKVRVEVKSESRSRLGFACREDEGPHDVFVSTDPLHTLIPQLLFVDQNACL